MQKSQYIVMKGVNWVHINQIWSNGLERSQLSHTMIKLGHMVLKGINWVYNTKIRSNGLERSQLGTQ